MHACEQDIQLNATLLFFIQVDTPRFCYEILHELFTGNILPITAIGKLPTENGALALAIKHNSIVIDLDTEELQNPKIDKENDLKIGSKHTGQDISSFMSPTSPTSYLTLQPTKKLQMRLKKEKEDSDSIRIQLHVPLHVPQTPDCNHSTTAKTTMHTSVKQLKDTNIQRAANDNVLMVTF